MICKNCRDNTRGKYCHNCGQKTKTQRLTLKHFIEHDVIHGVFHLDRGLPKTIRDILIHPGKVALDYIYGKRKKYYNFFYLLLLIIGFYLFLKSLGGDQSFASSFSEGLSNSNNDNEALPLANFIKKQKKIVIFSWIPIFTLASFTIFRKMKLSLIEFSIPSTIAVIGCSLFNILLTVTNQFITSESPLNTLGDILDPLLSLSIFLFPIFTFATFIKGYYTVLGKTWRLFVFYILVSLSYLLS